MKGMIGGVGIWRRVVPVVPVVGRGISTELLRLELSGLGLRGDRNGVRMRLGWISWVNGNVCAIPVG